MKRFMDDDFILGNDTAKHLFHDYAENLPIIDYHCHLSPREIYEDVRFDSLGDVWLGGKQADGSYTADTNGGTTLLKMNPEEKWIYVGEPDFSRGHIYLRESEL